MNSVRRALVPALLALPLALAACGGESDEEQIKSIISDATDDPASICDNASKALLEQLGGEEQCKEASKAEEGADADGDVEVEVKSVKVDGDEATADITDKEGSQTISFVKEDGDWKLATVG